MELLVGLPRMHKEAGERRDFLPEFVSFLSRAGFGDIVVEEGYGTGVGFETSRSGLCTAAASAPGSTTNWSRPKDVAAVSHQSLSRSVQVLSGSSN